MFCHLCVFVVVCVQFCMRAPPSDLEPATHHEGRGSKEEVPPDTPIAATCKVTPHGLDVRLGVCRNCRKFYKGTEVREYIVTSVHNTLALRFLGRHTIAVVALSDKGSKWTAKGFERIH